MRMSEKFMKFLRNLWKGNSLDIRRTRNGRWYDQKATPDVMSAICDVIVKETRRSNSFYPFTIRSIWTSESFEEQTKDFFNKPDTRNPRVAREYDKLIGQPLNVLAAAGLLAVKGQRPKVYSFASAGAKKLIAEMAGSEIFACSFLHLYISETLKQSGLEGVFERFFKHPDRASFSDMKDSFTHFIIDNTPINGEVECHRVFAKVLNVCAFVRKARGARRGYISKHPVTLSDIRYNRINSQDAAVDKPKGVPRQIWKVSPDHPVHGVHARDDRNYGERKVIKDIKSFHERKPEVSDSFSGVGLSPSVSVQGHHIFPRSEFPFLARVRENIILLTPTQHISHAHGGGGGGRINPAYQGFCLDKKMESVMECEKNPNCNFYSFGAFKEMLALVGILCDKSCNCRPGDMRCTKKIGDHTSDDVKREMWCWCFYHREKP